MKKLMLLVMMAVMLLFTGCPDKKPSQGEDNKIQVMKVNVKSAQVLMKNYMRYFMKRDNGAMHSFYSSKIIAKLKNTVPTKNPHPIGYSIGEGEGKDKKAEFKVHIFSGSTGVPYFSDDEFKYTVAIEKGKMVIDNIEKGKSVELYEKDEEIYKREADKINGKPILALTDLPKYVVSKESSSPEQKFPLPNKKFGPCAISSDGKTVIVTSYDINSFIGIINEEEATETMAQGGGGQMGGGKGGAQGGAEQGKGKEETKNKEAKENMKLKAIDFYLGSKIDNISFSSDGKMFVVQHTPKSGLSQILLYKSKNGEPVTLKSDRQFRVDRFSIINPYFSEPNELIFTVVPIKTATAEEKRFRGDWKLDIKKGEAKQIE